MLKKSSLTLETDRICRCFHSTRITVCFTKQDCMCSRLFCAMMLTEKLSGYVKKVHYGVWRKRYNVAGKSKHHNVSVLRTAKTWTDCVDIIQTLAAHFTVHTV